MSLFFLVGSCKKNKVREKKRNTRDSPKSGFAAKLVKRVKKQQRPQRGRESPLARTSVLVGSEDTVGNLQWSR